MEPSTRAPAAPSIAIVEDDASLRAALAFALEADGFLALAYDRGAPLLAAPIAPDCLVVDMRLPDLDGLTLVRRLRERGRSAPAILITTSPDDRTRRAAEALGVPIVEKPLITGELRRRIDELLAGNLPGSPPQP